MSVRRDSLTDRKINNFFFGGAILVASRLFCESGTTKQWLTTMCIYNNVYLQQCVFTHSFVPRIWAL